MGGVMTKSESRGTKKFSETSPCILNVQYCTKTKKWPCDVAQVLGLDTKDFLSGSHTVNVVHSQKPWNRTGRGGGGGGYKTCSSRGESLLSPSPLTQSLRVNIDQSCCYVTRAWVDRAMLECTPGWVCIVIGVVISPGYCIIFTMNLHKTRDVWWIII